MKRLFVAVDLDERTRGIVADCIARLAQHLRHDRRVGRITWVRTEHLHLTLRFLGDVDDAQAASVQQALAEPLTTAGFDLSFEGVGMFPGTGRPRVVWLGVAAGLSELESLYREVEARLQLAAVPPEPRPFQAHLTLGRFRESTIRPDLRAGRLGDAVIGPCPVDHVTLYESRLSSSGPTYTAIGHATAGPRP